LATLNGVVVVFIGVSVAGRLSPRFRDEVATGVISAVLTLIGCNAPLTVLVLPVGCGA